MVKKIADKLFLHGFIQQDSDVDYVGTCSGHYGRCHEFEEEIKKMDNGIHSVTAEYKNANEVCPERTSSQFAVFEYEKDKQRNVDFRGRKWPDDYPDAPPDLPHKYTEWPKGYTPPDPYK